MNTNYSYNFFKKIDITRYEADMQELLKEENPSVFLQKSKDWLRSNADHIEFVQKANLRHAQTILEHSIPVLEKISAVAAKSKYAIVRFDQTEFAHPVPVLEVIPEDNSKLFIRSPIPNARKFRITSIEDANHLVRVLASSGITADATEGCDAKTELSCHFLRHMRVADSAVKKILAKGSFFVLKEDTMNTVYWCWHVAPLVISESGEPYVIDTFFNKQRALSIQQWKARLGGRVDKLEIIESNHSYNAIRDTLVTTNDEVFEKQITRMVFFDFSSFGKQGELIQTILHTHLPKLELSKYEYKPLNPPQEKEKTASCTVS